MPDINLVNSVQILISSYEFYLDCMLLTGTLDIDDGTLDKIFNLATRNKHVKIDDPTRLEKVIKYVIFGHNCKLTKEGLLLGE